MVWVDLTLETIPKSVPFVSDANLNESTLDLQWTFIGPLYILHPYNRRFTERSHYMSHNICQRNIMPHWKWRFRSGIVAVEVWTLFTCKGSISKQNHLGQISSLHTYTILFRLQGHLEEKKIEDIEDSVDPNCSTLAVMLGKSTTQPCCTCMMLT